LANPKTQRLNSDSSLSLNVIFILTVLLLLSQLITQKQSLGDSLLFEMSKESISWSSRLHELTGESKTLEDIAQPEENLSYLKP
jgi:hypothetical protein